MNFLTHEFSDNTNVTVEQYAVSSQYSDTTLFSNEDGSGLSSLTQRHLDHSKIYLDSKENITASRYEECFLTIIYLARRLGQKYLLRYVF